MASEIRVDKINSLSGVGTVTLSPTGVDISGITTAATLKATTGIVTTLTATESAKVGSGVTLSPDGDVFTTGITTSSSVIVGGGVTISESGIEASGIGITCANINGGAVSGRRNMIINGDQRIAQRGTTAKLATTTASYKCVDRFKTDIDGSGGGDFYHAQTGTGTSISADVPTGQGFSHSSKITVNTSASQPTSESNHSQIYTILEKQDVYHLEWGTSAAKTCTLSFWVKSSVAGTYPLWMSIYTTSATQYYWTNYTINSANTWEKKVITVTGPTSGGAVDGTTATGLRIEWTLGVGSDSETGTLREWTTSSTFRTASGSVYLNENAGATWLMTGAQFEVGSQASAFEHRSFGDELALCQRYYQGANTVGAGYGSADGYARAGCVYSVPMRSTPTLTATNTGSGSIIAADSSATGFYITYGSLGGSSAGIFNYVATAEL